MANPLFTKPPIYLGEYQQITPQWVGTRVLDPRSSRSGGGHVNALEFQSSSNATVVTVGVAGAAANATSIPVAAISSALPSGTILDFVGAGKFAKLTAVAAKGATTLTVEALPQALVSADVAYYSNSSILSLSDGILLGRTYAERDAGIGYGPANVATDDQIHLLLYSIYNALIDNECELYESGSGNRVYENFIPGFATMPAATQAWIRKNYQCITGVA